MYLTVGHSGIQTIQLMSRCNDSSPRASAGVAIYWNTAVGPLTFIWGWPISEESYDKDNNFKFSIGTSF